jgi:hypothetical protein
MSRTTWSRIACLVCLVPAAALAQEPPKPGPEHEKFKEHAGTWDAIIKMGDAESKGTMVWKVDLGGLWLTSDFQGEFGGEKFSGKGLDSYDPAKKKYVGVWADSWSTSPMVSEGTYDEGGKVLTMTGEGPGPDGKPTKYKMTTEHKDKDTIFWTMFGPGPDGKEAPFMTISYKRRK